MTRNLKTCTFAILAFLLALLISHKLEVGIVAGVVVGISTYLTWWDRRPYVDHAVRGGMFCLIGIAVISRSNWLPGILLFVVAIAYALRANSEWKREHV